MVSTGSPEASRISRLKLGVEMVTLSSWMVTPLAVTALVPATAQAEPVQRLSMLGEREMSNHSMLVVGFSGAVADRITFSLSYVLWLTFSAISSACCVIELSAAVIRWVSPVIALLALFTSFCACAAALAASNAALSVTGCQALPSQRLGVLAPFVVSIHRLLASPSGAVFWA